MGIISEIISGVISPITGMVTAIWTTQTNADVDKYKVDGSVDTARLQVLGNLLLNKWLVACEVTMIIPTSIYYNKLLVWDKVLGWGHTDPLDGFASETATMIVGFLFLRSAILSFKK